MTHTNDVLQYKYHIKYTDVDVERLRICGGKILSRRGGEIHRTNTVMTTLKKNKTPPMLTCVVFKVKTDTVTNYPGM